MAPARRWGSASAWGEGGSGRACRVSSGVCRSGAPPTCSRPGAGLPAPPILPDQRARGGRRGATASRPTRGSPGRGRTCSAAIEKVPATVFTPIVYRPAPPAVARRCFRLSIGWRGALARGLGVVWAPARRGCRMRRAERGARPNGVRPARVPPAALPRRARAAVGAPAPGPAALAPFIGGRGGHRAAAARCSGRVCSLQGSQAAARPRLQPRGGREPTTDPRNQRPRPGRARLGPRAPGAHGHTRLRMSRTAHTQAFSCRGRLLLGASPAPAAPLALRARVCI
jgi:hypothetical protein